MSLLSRRILLATASAGCAALVGWSVLQWRAPTHAATIDFVDNTEQMTRLLSERAVPSGSPPPVPAPSGSAYPPPLVREPLTLEVARDGLYRVLARPSRYDFHPLAHLLPKGDSSYRLTVPEHSTGGWTTRTNHAGFLKDVELRAVPPDLRILVTGDSHTAGVVPNSESFANVLEALLAAERPERSVESLNAGVGGTSAYAYLGTYEARHETLEPDVLVVAVYGGNDFHGLMGLQRYFMRRRPPRFGPRIASVIKELPGRGVVGQVLAQTAYFVANPDDVEHARVTMDSITMEIARLCAARDCEPVFVYLPPPHVAQPGTYDDLYSEPMERLEITWEDVAVGDELGAGWVSFLAERGLHHVDMTPVFAAADEPCYWFADLHVNTLGHRLVAGELARVIGALAP